MIPLPQIEIVCIWIELGLREFAQVLGLFHTHFPTRVSHLTLGIRMRSIAKIT